MCTQYFLLFLCHIFDEYTWRSVFDLENNKRMWPPIFNLSESHDYPEFKQNVCYLLEISKTSAIFCQQTMRIASDSSGLAGMNRELPLKRSSISGFSVTVANGVISSREVTAISLLNLPRAIWTCTENHFSLKLVYRCLDITYYYFLRKTL